MALRTIIAAVSGLVTGITITIAATDRIPTNTVDNLAFAIAVRVAPITCALLIGHAALRKWLDDYTVQVRGVFRDASPDQTSTAAQTGVGISLSNRRSPTDAERVNALTACLAETQVQLHGEQKKNDNLQAEFDELVEDYNRLVTDALQRAADRFENKPADPARRCVARRAASGPVVSITTQRPAEAIEPRVT
ncbi:hypothetical protein HUT18_11980 [Streptomyces sp. NA04227]|uniref:hypothetical protein n=1 Tax=Streptomyces sp. NA04227 TaxID=2742136 RepID=UPI0015929CE4|nr:hypothetical protein [Streptomyces sp. NA04227]QKW07017.1 hypothetical protein HUT18_11980 [Streptomyces sp. NA04227]